MSQYAIQVRLITDEWVYCESCETTIDGTNVTVRQTYASREEAEDELHDHMTWLREDGMEYNPDDWRVVPYQPEHDPDYFKEV